jgi:cystathionine beta-lyase
MIAKCHLPKAHYRPPEGTYLAWLDCTWLGLHSDQQSDELGVVSDLAGPAKMFLDRARVALSSGQVFGSGGAGCVRLNFATSPAILRQALTRMGRAVREL